MQDDESHSSSDHNSGLDACAAVALSLIAVVSAAFWVSQH